MGTIKKAGGQPAFVKKCAGGLDAGRGLAQTLHAIAFLPLTALLEQINALVALQDIALDYDTLGTLEAFVLRHDLEIDEVSELKGRGCRNRLCP